MGGVDKADILVALYRTAMKTHINIFVLVGMRRIMICIGRVFDCTVVVLWRYCRCISVLWSNVTILAPLMDKCINNSALVVKCSDYSAVECRRSQRLWWLNIVVIVPLVVEYNDYTASNGEM